MKVAVAGSGYFAQFHLDSWSRLPVTPVALCSLDKSSAETFAQRYEIPALYADFDRMLDETTPDLVDIITPPTTHLPFASAALERGIPTICQKPFTNDLAEAQQLAHLSKETGTPLVIHENFRFQPWYREIARLLEEQRLGALYQIRFALRPGDGQGPDAYLARQPYFQSQEKFLIRETAVHFTDTFRFLAGEIDAVTADLRTLNPAISGEDAGLVILTMRSGVRCIFDGNRLADHAASDRRRTMGEMTIEGSKATLTLDGDANLWLRDHGDNELRRHTYQWDDQGFAGDCVHALQSHVLDGLSDEQAPLENTAADYLPNLVVEEAIYQSSALGKRLHVAG